MTVPPPSFYLLIPAPATFTYFAAACGKFNAGQCSMKCGHDWQQHETATK